MSLFSVYYEFPVTREALGFLVEDIPLTQARIDPSINVIDNVFSTIDRNKTYCSMEAKGRPGLMLKLSRRFEAECLPHPVEGIHAFVHGSSEGYLDLENFKGYVEACFSRRGIAFTRYDGV
jgi:hypothetical protein